VCNGFSGVQVIEMRRIEGGGGHIYIKHNVPLRMFKRLIVHWQLQTAEFSWSVWE
jgi:hypothetical protein